MTKIKTNHDTKCQPGYGGIETPAHPVGCQVAQSMEHWNCHLVILLIGICPGEMKHVFTEPSVQGSFIHNKNESNLVSSPEANEDV
jgi:hypothetical protein